MHIPTLSSLVSIGAVALALGCAGGDTPGEETPADDATAQVPDAVTADPGHYSVEFENDAVRLLRIAYGPGESSVMHSHPANCSIGLKGSSWQMTDADGAVTENDAGALGAVQCGEAEVHLPENTGSDAGEVILVEFKDGATAGSAETAEYPDAVTADPDHYSVEFENDAVRLVRVRYGAGETSVMHHHPANCVVFLGDQPGTFESPTGEVTEIPAGEVGLVNCTDGEVHLPTNTGDADLEVILVEFKGRETAAD